MLSRWSLELESVLHGIYCITQSIHNVNTPLILLPKQWLICTVNLAGQRY